MEIIEKTIRVQLLKLSFHFALVPKICQSGYRANISVAESKQIILIGSTSALQPVPNSHSLSYYTMTLSPSAALSILIPINLEHYDSAPGSPMSIRSVDIQYDDENESEAGERRGDRDLPAPPIRATAVIRPQFSCPDFSLGTTRGMKGRMKGTPSVPKISSIPKAEDQTNVDTSTNRGPKVRKKNCFVGLDPVTPGCERPLGKERMLRRNTSGIVLGRSYGFLFGNQLISD